MTVPIYWVQILILVTAAIGLLVSLYVLHKSRRIHLMTYALLDESRRIATKSNANLLRQIQAFDGLYRDLGFRGSLPTGEWAAFPDFLMVIAKHVQRTHPKVIIECGSGVSTVVLARCLQINGEGHVYSLDHDLTFADEIRANLARHGLTEWGTVIDAPLAEQQINYEKWLWYSAERVPAKTIDMLVVDGPPGIIQPLARYPAGPLLIPRLASNGIVFLDDAIRNDERKIIRRWRQEFPDLVERDHFCEKGCISLQRGAH